MSGMRHDATTETVAPLWIVAATEAEWTLLAERASDGCLERRPVRFATVGVGKATAAAETARLLATTPGAAPAACLLTGIAGTYAGSFVPVGSAVCASLEIDLDYGVAHTGDRTEALALPRHHQLASREAPDDGQAPTAEALGPGAWFATDAAWTRRAAGACGVHPVRFATSDGVSGDLDVAAARAARSGAAIESM
ncbi:MAG: hypothetical protein WD336_08565, partial [Trueperaceae bacterium]